jgi:hypothetical protein
MFYVDDADGIRKIDWNFAYAKGCPAMAVTDIVCGN